MSVSAKIWVSVTIAVGLAWAVFVIALYPDPEPLDEQLGNFGKVTDSNDRWHRGVLLHKSGEWDRAMAAYNEALEINPDALYAYMYRGKLKYDQGDYAGAVADYTTAIEMDPEFFYAVSARSVARYRAGDKKGADEDVALALQYNPTFPAINRAIMTRLDGNVDDALKQFEQLLADTPEGELTAPQILENLGTIKFEQGDHAGALEAYNLLLDEWPSLYRGFQMRAIILDTMGHAEEARADQQTYQNLLLKNRELDRQLQNDLNPPK